MSALTDLFTAFANKIRSKTGGSDTYTPPQMVSAIDDVYDAGVAAGTTPTQTKTVTAGTSATTVTPDAGYALSSVTVNPTPSQSKSATPTTSAQTISPDSGKLLSSVEVGAIQTQTKSATPTTSAQTISPDSGKYLSSVSVGAIPSEYIIPSGNKSITANGTGIDVKSYATASVSVSGTSITPSNSSPASMSSGTLYTPSASGYAISSYSSVTPSNSSPVSLSSGSIYKMGGAGAAVASVTSVAPSNSSPATLTSGTVYKPSANGYAISSYSDISPLASSAINLTANALYRPTTNGYAIKEYSACTPTTDGSYHGSGFVNMSRSGYSYSEKPTLHETTLWTNSSPSSDYASATVTLSSDIDNFDYIEVEFKSHKSQSSTQKTLMSVADFKLAKNSGFASQYTPRLAIGGSYNNNATVALRGVAYVSDTQVVFGTCRSLASSSSVKNDYAIPVSVIGVSWY